MWISGCLYVTCSNWSNSNCCQHFSTEQLRQMAFRHAVWKVKASSSSSLHDHTQTRHTRHNSSERVIIPTQRTLPDNTQHSEETDLYAPSGIRTHISSKRAEQTYSLDRALLLSVITNGSMLAFYPIVMSRKGVNSCTLTVVCFSILQRKLGKLLSHGITQETS